jgi:hypothetical protein
VRLKFNKLQTRLTCENVIFSIKIAQNCTYGLFYISRAILRMIHNYLTSSTCWSAQCRRKISRGTGTGIYLTKLLSSEVRTYCSLYALQLQSASTRNHSAACPHSEQTVNANYSFKQHKHKGIFIRDPMYFL